MSERVLITGITGHVGSYLAEFLLDKGYEVHGLIRRTSNFSTKRIDHIFDKVTLHYGDMLDLASLINIMKRVAPLFVYNLAAQSHVKVSDDLEQYTMDTNSRGVYNLIYAIRLLGSNIRMLQASTSEMYGNTVANGVKGLNEKDIFMPVSIYGISKLTAYHLMRYNREAFGLFLCNSISFNHESERRGETFVTRKISEYVKRLCSPLTNHNQIEPLKLGNLYAKRDWSHTLDIVRGMYLIMHNNLPKDYVLASGQSHSVKDYVIEAFKVCGIDLDWFFEGTINEYACIQHTDKKVVVVDDRYYRPIDIDCLVGDATRAYKELNWRPEISFKELVRRMVQ